jgi:hypothetical protein
MAHSFGDNIKVQRTGAATWVVYRKGVSMGSFTTKRAAISLAAGLAGGSTAQEEYVGDLKTAVGEVQVITLTDFSGTDSFTLRFEDLETVPFVRGTNATAAAIQTALRTQTGDSTLTCAGDTDAGPFTVTFVAETTSQALLQQGVVSGCTLAVARTVTGGVGV